MGEQGPNDLISQAANDMIELSGPCQIQDSRGVLHRVDSIWTARESYIPDVLVCLRHGADDDDHHDDHEDHDLWDDEVFLQGVMARLRDVGYTGPDFGRGELGAQSSSRVSLEPCDEFCEWLMEHKGWRYADGRDEWEAGKLLREIPWRSFIEFEAPDGRRLGARLSPLVETHAEKAAERHGGSKAAALRDETLPLFTSEPKEAMCWALAFLRSTQGQGMLQDVLVELRPTQKADPLLALQAQIDEGQAVMTRNGAVVQPQRSGRDLPPVPRG